MDSRVEKNIFFYYHNKIAFFFNIVIAGATNNLINLISNKENHLLVQRCTYVGVRVPSCAINCCLALLLNSIHPLRVKVFNFLLIIFLFYIICKTKK